MHEPSDYTKQVQASGEPEFREIGVGPWSQEHPGEPRPDVPGTPAFDACYDTDLLDHGDRRNVLDRYRYWTVDAIKADLDARSRYPFEIAVENWTHDVDYHPSIKELATSWRYRIAGEIAAEQARANAYDIRAQIGHRPLSADEQHRKTQSAHRLETLRNAKIIALDIIPGAVPIERYRFPERCLLLFGAEGPGLSHAALDEADDVVYISQFGSVRSINAGAAAAVAMHSWVAQHAVIDGPGAAADSGSSAVIKA